MWKIFRSYPEIVKNFQKLSWNCEKFSEVILKLWKNIGKILSNFCEILEKILKKITGIWEIFNQICKKVEEILVKITELSKKVWENYSENFEKKLIFENLWDVKKFWKNLLKILAQIRKYWKYSEELSRNIGWNF